jgi:hypothetical protein
MAITIRVPDPTDQYEIGNQRQIVRAINNFIQQINAQYKTRGDTFSEIEQLSYFLGYSPNKPSGPATSIVGGTTGGIIYSRIGVAEFFGGGFGPSPAGSFQASRNRGYLVIADGIGGLPDPATIVFPQQPPVGTKVAVTNGSGYNIILKGGYDSTGYSVKIDGYFTQNLSSFPPGKSRTFVYFGDGGYPAGYKPGPGYVAYNTWYSIARGYN